MPAAKLEADAKPLTVDGDSFAPLYTLMMAARFWWLVLFLAVIGGMAGWLASRLQPPLYEAVVRLSSGIDYVSTGPMTQFEEDTAFEMVGGLIYSDQTAQVVVQQAVVQGIQTNLADLKRSATLERRVNVFELRVRQRDPQTAQRLANLWVDAGQSALLEAYQHSLKAADLNRYLLSLENCLSQTASSEPSGGQCSQTRFSQIQVDLRDAGKAYNQERVASRGIFPGLVIGDVEHANIPASPILYNRNQMVLASCLIGLLLGVVMVQTGLPARWSK